VKRPYPFQVFLPAGEGGLDVDSVVTLNHIRSIDHQRLVLRLGRISDRTLMSVDDAIRISLDLPGEQ
jgi:mRNA interferase MazF